MSYLNKRCTQLTKPLFGHDGITSKIKTVFTIFFLSLLFYSSGSFGQAGDLSQIRNGNGKLHNAVLDTCGSCWVNGNAGAQNAHYREGMSISYRSLLTGLQIGAAYEYEIGYDTYHGAMAIDYLTHFQRLEPHNFDATHPAEVINPLAMVSGSKKYNMTVTGGIHTFPFGPPAASGIASGVFNSNGTIRNVFNQPATSFSLLPASEKLLTIYNGQIILIRYVSQDSIKLGGANAETKMRIRFRASSDSVVLAWGGHIATRSEWGYTKDSKGKLIPLSAGGISGSPYHMRQKALDKVADNTNITPTVIQNITGFGNQDRSLAAAAVLPPPECPTVPSLTKCLESTSFNFTIDNPDGGTVYTWSLTAGKNNVDAAFPGGVSSVTGTSITVVHKDGGSFKNGGTFKLDISATKNGSTISCDSVATGTVIDVYVDAKDGDNALQLDLNASASISLGLDSISPGTASDYTFEWKLVSSPSTLAKSSFSNLNTPNLGDATFNVDSPHVEGVYTVRVIATQIAAPYCKDSSDVTIDAKGGVNCEVNGPSSVCPGSQNVYFYDPNKDGVKDPIPVNFTALWSFRGTHPSAEFKSTNLTADSVIVDFSALGTNCNTEDTIQLTLTSTSKVTITSCYKVTKVEDKEPPVITECPEDKTLECGASTAPSNTGFPKFTDNCSADTSHTDVTVSNCNRTVITRTWTVKDTCGNVATCTQIITLTDSKAPTITCPADKTGTSALASGASTLPANTGTATATDDCTGTTGIIIYYKDAPAINVPNGGITRTWYAVDQSGNSSSCVQNIAFASTTSTLRVSSTEQTAVVSTSKGAVTEVVKEANKSSVVMAAKPLSSALQGLQVNAFPNPFTNKVTFRLSSDVSGKAILEVYNNQGQQLGVVYEGMIKAGINQDVQYNASKLSSGILLYRLRVNNKSVNGKLNQLK